MSSRQGTIHPAHEALPVGKSITVRKTVGETDVYLFAGISGDFAPLHVDEDYMRGTKYGRRIAHGALMLAYMSRASTAMAVDVPGRNANRYTRSVEGTRRFGLEGAHRSGAGRRRAGCL